MHAKAMWDLWENEKKSYLSTKKKAKKDNTGTELEVSIW